MGLHNLQPAPGSTKNRKRVGRGAGSGTGKTAGRGNKVKSQDLVTAKKEVLRVDKCHFTKDYLKLVLLLE